MQILPSKFIAKNQAKLFFVLVWLHVSTLDFFYVSYSGPVFFWQESLQLTTLAIHFSVALLTLGFYYILMNFFQRVQRSKSTLISLQSSELKSAASKNSSSASANSTSAVN